MKEMAHEADAIEYCDLDPAQFSVLLIRIFPDGRVHGGSGHKYVILDLRAIRDFLDGDVDIASRDRLILHFVSRNHFVVA